MSTFRNFVCFLLVSFLVSFLVYSDTKIIGLKRTKESYIKEILAPFENTPIEDLDTNNIENAIRNTGLFSDINIQLQDNETLIIEVKEKISFIPLPLAAYSNGNGMCGLFLMDTNALGQADVAMLGGLYSNKNKMGMLMYSHAPKSLTKLGYTVFGSIHNSDNDINNADDNKIYEYDSYGAKVGSTISARFLRRFVISIGGNYSYEKTEHDEFLPVHIGAGNIGLHWGTNNWNGVFTSSIVLGSTLELSRHSLSGNLAKDIAFQSLIQVPLLRRLRVNCTVNATRTKDLHITQYKTSKDASISILNSDFITRNIAGATFGPEVAFLITKNATFTIYTLGECVAAQDIYTSKHSKYNKYFNKHKKVKIDNIFIDYGVSAGLLVYLSKINLPAIKIGYGYNISRRDGYFCASLGMGM